MRQATLIAIGNAVDSITFTSNSLVPTPGIWGHNSNGGIWLNGVSASSAFNFCNVEYATSGIGTAQVLYIKNSSFVNNQNGITTISNVPVDSCVFKFNQIGIANLNNSTLNFCTISNNGYGVEYSTNVIMNDCTIDSNGQAFGGVTAYTNSVKLHDCSISYNQYGFMSNSSGGNLLSHCRINFNTVWGIVTGNGGVPDSIINCEIKYNGTGIRPSGSAVITHCDIEYDTIGVYGCANLYCNKICNNISYGLQMRSSGSCNASNNYWCTTDSAQIAAAIYDGYDNVSFGLVTFMPVDSLCSPGIITLINETAQESFSFSIFPNPAANHLTVELPVISSRTEIKIFNMLGALTYSSVLINQKTIIDVSTLMSGAYIIEVATSEGISRQKLITQ